ncbi:MAG: hypothetical protein COT81_04565 [Candidatus Buchananbacteria bacterium CG10_big_fil_rev_8_21_14_0_10_42_9]|uniref:Uncharacterized protein n=1 Tax=Candidatus Buchananbacteria bacterium CG10_big_fil_rev_8_21_14_0_10_42_9 TaxID=1974526 RepID=A0A2H0W0A9_9BACT|nr:MAG: hypothetical protein COT81_04565 [Candidatus Buchananbacteria bacterium CG10_big_fil_rev_8_21_14_0_10_42_9]
MTKLNQVKNLNTLIFIASVVVAIAIVAVVLFFSDAQKASTYTVADFPDAASVVGDPEVIQTRVDKINEYYSQLGSNGGADDFIYWMNIGLMKRNLADYRGAEGAWQEALNHGRNSVVFGNLASLYFYEFKEPVKAIEYYNEAIRINPHNFSYYQDLAGVYRYELNQFDKVEEVMLEAAQRDVAQDNNYYLYLVDFYDEQGNEDKFQEYLNKILSNNPNQNILDSLESSGYTST